MVYAISRWALSLVGSLINVYSLVIGVTIYAIYSGYGQIQKLMKSVPLNTIGKTIMSIPKTILKNTVPNIESLSLFSKIFGFTAASIISAQGMIGSLGAFIVNMQKSSSPSLLPNRIDSYNPDEPLNVPPGIIIQRELPQTVLKKAMNKLTSVSVATDALSAPAPLLSDLSPISQKQEDTSAHTTNSKGSLLSHPSSSSLNPNGMTGTAKSGVLEEVWDNTFAPIPTAVTAAPQEWSEEFRKANSHVDSLPEGADPIASPFSYRETGTYEFSPTAAATQSCGPELTKIPANASATQIFGTDVPKSLPSYPVASDLPLKKEGDGLTQPNCFLEEMEALWDKSSNLGNITTTAQNANLLHQTVWDVIESEDNTFESMTACMVNPFPTLATLPQVTEEVDNAEALAESSHCSSAPIYAGLSDKDSDQGKLEISVASFDKAAQAVISEAKTQKEIAEAAAKKESEAQKQFFKKAMKDTPQYGSWVRRTLRALRRKAKEEVEKEQAEKVDRKRLRSAL